MHRVWAIAADVHFQSSMMNWLNLSNEDAMRLAEDSVGPVYATWHDDFETTPKPNENNHYTLIMIKNKRTTTLKI